MEEILTNIISYGYTDNREHEIEVRPSVQLAEVSVDQPVRSAGAGHDKTVGRKEDRWSQNSSCAQTHWTDFSTSAKEREIY